MFKTAIFTISDTRKKSDDLSGNVIKNLLPGSEYKIELYDIICDNENDIYEKLIYCADKLKLDLILTTGGTGLAPSDVTPQATLKALDVQAPGISEHIRMQGIKKTNRAMLSRGVAGLRKTTLVINFPGSPKGVAQSLEVVLDVIPHAIAMARGGKH